MRSFDLAFRSGLALLLSLAAATSNANDGDLDPAFGVNGVAHTGLTNTQAYAAAIRPDGRVVVCGSYSNQTSWADEFFVAQYRPDGSLDPSFASNGIAYIDFTSVKDTCSSMAISPDGRVVVAGSATSLTPFSTYYRPVLARLKPDGTLDAGFGSAGQVVYEKSGFGEAVALQADGAIVLAGFAYNDSLTGSDFVVIRLQPDGTPDPLFGTDGRVVIDFQGERPYDVAAAIAIDSQQRIVVAGTVDEDWSPGWVGVARMLPNGQLDDAFGTGGLSIVGSDRPGVMSGFAMKLTHDGKILVAGDRTVNSQTDMMVARLLDDGSLDATFGAQGIATVAFAPQGVAWQSGARGLDEQSDGKVVLAGWVREPDNNGVLAVARIDANGNADPTFGDAGFSTFDLAETPDADHTLDAIALSGGRILAAGTAATDLLIRLQNDLIFADSF